MGRELVEHLKAVLAQHYELSTDCEGKTFVGFTFKWDYKPSKVHVSMPSYVNKILTRCQYKKPKKLQHQPHPHVRLKYGQKQQVVEFKNLHPFTRCKTKTVHSASDRNLLVLYKSS